MGLSQVIQEKNLQPASELLAADREHAGYCYQWLHQGHSLM